MNIKGLIRGLTGWLGKPVAGPETDPQRFFGTLYALPNPDPILREMGQAERVYASIAADPHVLGDIRSIRGNFRSHQYRLVEGDQGSSQSAAALQLCEQWLQRNRPSNISDWLEVMWQMSSAFMTGYRPHELVWSLQGGKYLPEQVIDRPGRRIKFNAYAEPLLVTSTNQVGAPVEPWQFVISRHMADQVNPYGVAVLSACFWCWTFKTGGWRYFVKYCERHGLPWPVARYPMGTSDKDQEELEKALANMIEASYLVTQEGNGVELLSPSGSGTLLPQEALIDRCNREMSKALTGQAMVAELQGTGARAASETALKRQEAIDDSVRDISAQSMGEIFRWITLFNFGDGVAPPTLEFFQHEKAGKDRADTYKVARDLGANPSKSALLEELGIPEAENEADRLQPPAAPGAGLPGQPGAAGAGAGGGATPADTAPADAAPADRAAALHARAQTAAADCSFSGPVLHTVPGFMFARAAGMTEEEAMQLAADAADQAIADDMIAPVALMLERYEREGRTLAEFAADLGGMVGQMDDASLREVIERSLRYAILRGAATNAA